MSMSTKEIVFLLLQFLEEEKFKETLHKLEQESGQFFNLKHFEELVTEGKWDEVEKYLLAFTKVDDNRYSMKIFFEIRKQKYLEALDRKAYVQALDILVNDLKVFSAFNKELFEEITHLLTLENFRENEKLSKYGDIKSGRSIMLVELKKLIEANPLFRDKIQFPTLNNSKLRSLINQSSNWQHQKNPKPKPEFNTLFADHNSGQSNGAPAVSPVTNPLIGVAPKPVGFPPTTSHNLSPCPSSTPATLPSPLAAWMANQSWALHPSTSAGHAGLSFPSTPSVPSSVMEKNPRSPANNPAINDQTPNSDPSWMRSRPIEISDEVIAIPATIPAVTCGSQSQGQSSSSSDDLPKTVMMTLNQGSAVKSMDFHPVHQVLLLVGTNKGEVMLWDVGRRERILARKFKIWDLGACSMALQACMSKDYMASVNRIRWNPEGNLVGIAYSKHIVQILSYHSGAELRNRIEIEAHVGSVNDLAFSYPNKQPCVVSCGEDRVIKVWDLVTGAKQYTFEGHEAPVYSICPHHKENIQFIFSTATDGEIKAWLYDSMVPHIDYKAPGHSSIKMAYSADGKRLFSCGTNKEGESYLVEWNEIEGAVKRTYYGLVKQAVGIVQFETLKNRYLAAGDNSMVKFWDMDTANLVTSTQANGGLAACPCIKVNKDGTLLAVSTNENDIKILANADGIRLLPKVDSRAHGVSRVASAAVMEHIDNRLPVNGKSGSTDDSVEKSRSLRLTEINKPSQCRSLRLPDSLPEEGVSRLIYTNSGTSILALSSNGVHKLWKWQQDDRNSAGKATAAVAPQQWQPSNGLLMSNDISDTNAEDAVHCFALSKNDSYLISASGGKISLFNMMSLKSVATFLSPPPTATFLAFHPSDNNIIAVGMDDSTVRIYNVRTGEVSATLKGHQKHITGLAFSNVLNVLVSSGADSKLCVWSTDEGEEQASKVLQIPRGQAKALEGDTQVQFHLDQRHLLTIHETHISTCEAPRLEFLKQWVPPEVRGPITHATYSCDSRLIYVCFEDGSVDILTSSTLRLRCRINPSTYLLHKPSLKVYPLVIAAHPLESNQFALGLTDGGVYVFEPLESEGMWGTSLPETGAASSIPDGAATTEQSQR